MAVLAFWLPSKVIPFLGPEFILHSENILDNTISLFKLFFAQPFGKHCSMLSSMCAWVCTCLGLTPPPRTALELSQQLLTSATSIKSWVLAHCLVAANITSGNTNNLDLVDLGFSRPRPKLCLVLSLKIVSFLSNITCISAMATSRCEVKPCRIPVPVIEREATTLPKPWQHLG